MKFCVTLLVLCFTFTVFGTDKEKTIAKIEQNSSPLKKAEAYNKACQKSWQSGEYSESLVFARKGLSLCTEPQFDVLKAKLLNNSGVAYDYLGEYTKSLNAYFQALKIQEKLDDPEMEAYILSNIGLIYSNQDRDEKALEYHSKSLKIRRLINYAPGISASLNNIAIIYVMRKQFRPAISNYLECMEIDMRLGDKKGLSDDYNNISISYMELKNYDSTEYYLKKAMDLRIELKDRLGIAQTLSNYGTLRSKQKRYPEARSYFLQVLHLAKDIEAKDILKYSYNNLVDIETAVDDSAAAFNYYKSYIAVRDSIDNVGQARLQTEAELNYRFEKEKEKTKLLQEKKEEKAQVILFAVTGILILIVFFSILLFRRWKLAQRQQQIISEKNALVEQKNEEILASITYAKRIQGAILPALSLRKEILPDHFISYLPKDIVAGDFYWLEKVKSTIFFAVADCTGHGVPGALMSVVCHNALNRSIREYQLTDPGEILDKTRELIVDELSKNDESVSDGMDISLCAMDENLKTLKWAGANNPIWIYRKENQELEEIKGDKQPIGKYTLETAFNTHEITIHPGDRLFLSSDGFADQFGGEEGKKIKTKKLKSLLIETASMHLAQQQAHCENFFQNWKGNLEQVDDVCLLGIEF